MDNRYYREEVYENLSEDDKKKVDGIYKVVNEHCKSEGIKLHYGDPAEYFVGAITEYLIKSGEIKI